MRFLGLLGRTFLGRILGFMLSATTFMAVEDKYSSANIQAGKLEVPAFIFGDKLWSAIGIVEVAAADSDNSIYRVFKGLDPETVLAELRLFFDAFGAAGTLNIGVYEAKIGGEAFDDNVFANAVDISAAAKNQDGMIAVDIADRQKRLYEHAGHTTSTKKASYDIVIKVTNTGATGLGTIMARLEYLQG